MRMSFATSRRGLVPAATQPAASDHASPLSSCYRPASSCARGCSQPRHACLHTLSSRMPRGVKVVAAAGPKRYEPADEETVDRIDRQWKGIVSESEAMRKARVEDPTLNFVPEEEDKKLAAEDTRAWCAERCLATGHCEVAEDLWQMTTEQVVVFCQECASEEGCQLSYDKAEEYVTKLGQAAGEEVSKNPAYLPMNQRSCP